MNQQLHLFHSIDPLKDGISNIDLLDHMGDDLTVVNAARVSMAKESSKLSKQDCGLISYLAKHDHWTPFSHPQVQLRIKMPIFIARQWFKHQIGFTRNETSRRYVDDSPEFYIPTVYRSRAANVKQGSGGEPVGINPDWVQAMYSEAREWYESLLGEGVCPEQARMVLPQGTYTEFIETGSLAAYARLVKLRLDSHAQYEIRMYAQAIDKLLAPLFPVSWTTLMERDYADYVAG